MQDRSAAPRLGVVIYPGVEAIDIGGTVGFILMARRVPPAIKAVTIPANRDRWRSPAALPSWSNPVSPAPLRAIR